MATQTTPHTHPAKNADPTEVDGDVDQRTSKATEDSDGRLLADTDMAQTAGNRNERVTEYHGTKHNLEPGTEAGPASDLNQKSATGTGVTNLPIGDEVKQQERVLEKRADRVNPSAEEQARTSPVEEIEGGLRSAKEAAGEKIHLSTGTPVR